MIRLCLIATALLIMGMLIQSLSAAVPDLAPLDQSFSSLSTDIFGTSTSRPDHGSMGPEMASDSPCHENPPDETRSNLCSDCESDCDTGACASTCSISGQHHQSQSEFAIFHNALPFGYWSNSPVAIQADRVTDLALQCVVLLDQCDFQSSGLRPRNLCQEKHSIQGDV